MPRWCILKLKILSAPGKALNLVSPIIIRIARNWMEIVMTDMNLEQARFNMIEQQIRPWDVLDQKVLDIMVQVPREEFVPEAYRNLAFTDIEIPLDHGQSMLTPKIEAKLLQALDINKDDDILQVGTGSGYVCALLASLGGHVTSVDLHADLQEKASKVLVENNIRNVTMECSDAAQGWNPNRTFDVIAIMGSLPVLPESFQLSLNKGGRLFAFVGDSPVTEAVLITRVGDNEWSHEVLFETDVPELENAPQPERFSL